MIKKESGEGGKGKRDGEERWDRVKEVGCEFEHRLGKANNWEPEKDIQKIRK